MTRWRSVATSVVELAVVADLAAVCVRALEGTAAFPPAGPGVLPSQTTLLGVLLALFLCRRVVRGQGFGGFLMPLWLGAIWARARLGTTAVGGRIRASAWLRSVVTVAIVLLVVAPVLAGLVAYRQHGLTGRYYATPDWSGAPLLVAHDRVLGLRRPYYDLVNPGLRYSVEWDGVIYIPVTGAHRFAVESDGAAELWIDEDRLVNNRGLQDIVSAEAVATLGRGFHRIRVRYVQYEDAGAFAATWRRVGPVDESVSPKQSLSRAMLLPRQPTLAAWQVYRTADTILRATRLLFLGSVVAVFLFSCHRLLIAAQAHVREYHLHFLLQGGLALLFLFSAFLSQTSSAYFGFRALSHLGPGLAVLALLSVGGVILALGEYRQTIEWLLERAQASLERHPWRVYVLAVLGVGLCFILRNEFVNSDGRMLRWYFPQQVAEAGADVSLDEMWETYLHSRFWAWTNAAFGWSVRVSYQVVSSVAGGIFFLLLWRLSRRLLPSAALPYCLVMLSGGYMQLFFGDVENYTMVGAIIMGYYLTSVRCLQARLSVVVPTVALALAMTFHMLAGFLLPSLAFLYLIELHRRHYRRVALGALMFVVVFGVTFAVVGLPVEELSGDSWTTSSLLQLGRLLSTLGGEPVELKNWALFAFDTYHWEQYNLLALLMPAHLMAIALIWWRRVRMDQTSLYLTCATGGMMLFLFNYKTLIGVYHDWNLYANAAVPLALVPVHGGWTKPT